MKSHERCLIPFPLFSIVYIAHLRVPSLSIRTGFRRWDHPWPLLWWQSQPSVVGACFVELKCSFLSFVPGPYVLGTSPFCRLRCVRWSAGEWNCCWDYPSTELLQSSDNQLTPLEFPAGKHDVSMWFEGVDWFHTHFHLLSMDRVVYSSISKMVSTIVCLQYFAAVLLITLTVLP